MWKAEWEVRSVEREVGGGVRSAERGLWSVELRVPNVECEVWSEKRGVLWGLECKVKVECGARSVGCRM